MEHPLITTNPGIEGGKPIINGTRITVEMLADEYAVGRDRKSTRLNSSHGYISYAVFCLKKKKKNNHCRVRPTEKEWRGLGHVCVGYWPVALWSARDCTVLS